MNKGDKYINSIGNVVQVLSTRKVTSGGKPYEYVDYSSSAGGLASALNKESFLERYKALNPIDPIVGKKFRHRLATSNTIEITGIRKGLMPANDWLSYKIGTSNVSNSMRRHYLEANYEECVIVINNPTIFKKADLPITKVNDAFKTIEAEVKDEEKALRYNEGKLDWTLVHYRSLVPMVEVLAVGAKKYAKDNWKKGFDRETLLASTMRHLTSLLDGQENDEESKLSHAGHIMCNMMFYCFHFVIKK